MMFDYSTSLVTQSWKQVYGPR